MELYTLVPDLFTRDKVVDDYISLIWTERFIDSGDVTLIVSDTAANRALLPQGTILNDPDSPVPMLVETRDIQDGTIKLTGFTLDKVILENRFVVPSNDLEQTAFATPVYTPGEAMAAAVNSYCSTGGPFVRLGIELGYQELTGFTTQDDTVGGVMQDISVPRGALYDWIKKIGQTENIGWELTVTDAPSYLFRVYTGRNLCSDQSTYPVVRFSPALDSLTDLKAVESISGYKTVAYAISPGFDAETLVGGSQYTGKAEAYTNAEFDVGLGRRALLVEISGITAESVNDDFSTYQNIMDRHAKDALANNNFTKVIDGEVVPQSEYTFGVDYLLGDIVELQDQYGYIQKARITEYIRTKDANGTRQYPTVSVIT